MPPDLRRGAVVLRQGCTTDDPGRTWTTGPKSARKMTSGCSTATSLSKCHCGLLEECVDHLSLTSEVGVGDSAPLTRRRALLASCLAAVGDRPTMGAISSNGRSNMSWRTKARRSAGAMASSTTKKSQADRVGK